MQPSDDWWQTFFHGAVLEMWSRAVPPEQTRTEAAALEKALGVPQGARVLDVPCGNGRLALQLAARGYRMTGLDLADEYVAGAKVRSAERGLDVDWRQGDMRQLPFQAEFDAAYVAHEVAYHQQVIEAIDGVLIPGAANAELKALLVKVRPAFDAHLEHAQHLQRSLGSR